MSGSSGAMSGLSIEARRVVSSLFCGMIFGKGLKRTAFMSFLTVSWHHTGITDVPYEILQLLTVIKETGKARKVYLESYRWLKTASRKHECY